MAIGLSEAGESLRDYFGPRLNASESDGPDRMRDALVEKWHISKDEAKKLVDDLIDAGSVRWVSGGTGASVSEPGIPRDAAITGNQVGVTGLPLGVARDMSGAGNQGEGYWQFM